MEVGEKALRIRLSMYQVITPCQHLIYCIYKLLYAPNIMLDTTTNNVMVSSPPERYFIELALFDVPLAPVLDVGTGVATGVVGL